MGIELCDILNEITVPSAIHIQRIIREATKYNIELLKLYLLINNALFRKYPLYLSKEKFILL
jgi:hypothetical protein